MMGSDLDDDDDDDDDSNGSSPRYQLSDRSRSQF